jgi:hypothetical protein
VAQAKPKKGKNMKHYRTGKSVWSGSVAAAALFMASHADALSWCPTPGNNQITCSGCSRELTCNPVGIGIVILGNAVTLDGKGYWMNYAPGVAVQVSGFGSTIKNLNIQGPANSGILYNSSVSSSMPASIQNVTINEAGFRGVDNSAPQPLSISNSFIYGSKDVGVRAATLPNVDIRYSTVAYGKLDGYIATSGNGKNSWIIENNFVNNFRFGLAAYSSTGVVINNNVFSNNFTGVVVNNSYSGSFKYNYGRNNLNQDCNASGTISHAGNDWGTYFGSNCIP